MSSIQLPYRTSALRARNKPNQALLLLALPLLIAFVVGLVLKDRFLVLVQVNRLAGLGLMAIYGLYFIQNRSRIPTEILLYGGFILWGAISGAIVAADRRLFIDALSTLVQLWGLAWAVAGLTALQRDARIAFISLIVGAVVLVSYGFISGDFEIANALQNQTSSLVNNPNTLGFYALLGIVGLLYFWESAQPRWLRVGLLSLMGFLSLGIVYSGSRKAFLGALAFLVLWLWFCYRWQVFGNLRNVVFILLILGGSYWLADYALAKTIMGVRLEMAIDDGGLGVKRTGMYLEGWELFKRNPMAGVGLGNFTAYSIYRTYSHSDYMEALSTTGIFGTLLYFSIYPVLWKRLTRLQNRVDIEPKTGYHVGLFKAFILTLLMLAIGRINFQSILNWVALAGIIGYAWSYESAGPKLKRSCSVKSVRK